MDTRTKINNICKEIENNTNKISTQDIVDRILGSKQNEILNVEENKIENKDYHLDMDTLEVYRRRNNDCCNVKYYNKLKNIRPVIGPIVVILGKFIRKILRLVIEPIVDKQNNFNASVTASINALCNNEIVTQQFIKDVSSKINDIEFIKNKISDIENKFSDIENKFSDIENKFSDVENKISDIENKFSDIENKFSDVENKFIDVENKFSDVENKFSDIENKFSDVENKIVQNNILFSEKLDYINFKIYQISNLQDQSSITISKDKYTLEDNNKHPQNTYDKLDYFDFENHFRGSRKIIKDSQRDYLKYFNNKTNVLDLGCGRGEFLELLKENNITSIGVEQYKDFVEYCLFKNLDVKKADIIEFLQSVQDESIGGVMCSQVVEHLNTDQILSLCSLSYKKLQKNSYLVIETPNPTNLAMYINCFYVDPSHIKPVHPKTLEYFLRKAGFQDIEVIFTNQSKVNYRLPLLSGENINNLSDFNDGLNFLSDIIFGSQDYAIVAKK